MEDMELYRRLGRAVAERRAENSALPKVTSRIRLGTLLEPQLANLESGRQRIMVHQLFALVQMR